jgi:DNA-binding LytR/AlgR family response regulator
LISDIKDTWNDIHEIKKIIEENTGIHVIIYTDKSDFVYEGYEIGVYRYIDDNCSDKVDCLKRAILKALSNNNSIENNMIFSFKEGNMSINYNNIVYIEKSEKMLLFHIADGKILHMRGYLSEIYNQVNNYEFLKVHRGYIVNCRYIKEIKNHNMYLKTKEIIPISRRLYADIKERYGDYMQKRLNS